MEAEAFDLVREQKELLGERGAWDEIADIINKRNGTRVTGEQVKKFVARGKMPSGGWLMISIEDALGIRRRHPKKYISFKDGGSHD